MIVAAVFLIRLLILLEKFASLLNAKYSNDLFFLASQEYINNSFNGSSLAIHDTSISFPEQYKASVFVIYYFFNSITSALFHSTLLTLLSGVISVSVDDGPPLLTNNLSSPISVTFFEASSDCINTKILFFSRLILKEPVYCGILLQVMQKVTGTLMVVQLLNLLQMLHVFVIALASLL